MEISRRFSLSAKGDWWMWFWWWHFNYHVHWARVEGLMEPPLSLWSKGLPEKREYLHFGSLILNGSEVRKTLFLSVMSSFVLLEVVNPVDGWDWSWWETVELLSISLVYFASIFYTKRCQMENCNLLIAIEDEEPPADPQPLQLIEEGIPFISFSNHALSLEYFVGWLCDPTQTE